MTDHFQAFQGFENFGPGRGGNRPSPVSELDPTFADLLELNPDIPFQGAVQRANLTPNLFRRFQGQRSQFFNQFQGLLDERIRAGLPPDLRFADFTSDIDFQEEAFKLSPSDRFGAGSTTRFNPRTSFIR